MKIYDFFDTDASGTAEYDLCGQSYTLLLQTCFAYCDSVSFFLRSPESPDPVDIPSSALPISAAVRELYRHDRAAVQLRHYRLTEAVQAKLLQVTDSLFSWIDGWGFHNPEDPAFYRADGSVFFSSVIHEGRCTLHVRDGEDVSALTALGLWIPRK